MEVGMVVKGWGKNDGTGRAGGNGWFGCERVCYVKRRIRIGKEAIRDRDVLGKGGDKGERKGEAVMKTLPPKTRNFVYYWRRLYQQAMPFGEGWICVMQSRSEH
ncbi:hypothetical protein ACH5RR_025798 [Cinchona calisaya]|uniref:Uncharacterized protein n=1 Tax=Cinchona calisaya TaxID=153742 RepID=A0ABD2Z0P1_9GENT